MRIATVRLAPGVVGYYDELSRIHLTLSHPSTHIYDYMDTTKLQHSVACGTLKLVDGFLVREETSFEKVETPVIPEVDEKIEEIEPKEEIKEEVVEEIVPEEVVELSEEKPEEEVKKKRKTKKSKKDEE